MAGRPGGPYAERAGLRGGGQQGAQGPVFPECPLGTAGLLLRSCSILPWVLLAAAPSPLASIW